eukprot:CAMPEP_0183452246 /NCGR_PEP_ID=MMETSP0370-20130417/117367_1 /TAXON_ID=268820 /ORGANISM="Peridinium aciculiferum, Strain PAER-2" /LENGTH=53 /DNA_ID=CAMNT_0025643539 /DNA_START=103 /DNA_END=262 /DNA_ORIENTATION=-
MTSRCYEKGDGWASCMPSCTPGIHEDEDAAFQTPWAAALLRDVQGEPPLHLQP